MTVCGRAEGLGQSSCRFFPHYLAVLLDDRRVPSVLSQRVFLA
jgi:hypothetical protein